MTLRLFSCTALLSLAPIYASALTITLTENADILADTLFLNASDTVITGSALLSSGSQVATYSNTSGTYGLPVTGIALSSGNVANYGDEYTGEGSTPSGASATAAQNALLTPITGQANHYDVAQLTIDFIPTVSLMTFFATFGSMEWPTYVGSSFIDGFGLYVNGVNVAGAVATGGTATQAININHPDMTSVAGTSLNGILAPNANPVLQFDVPVVIGEVNTFDIILADASDSVLDTTVYLSSFVSTESPSENGTGQNEFSPFLPSNPPDPETSEYVITLPVPPEENVTFWIDPPIAVGYVYEVSEGVFSTLTMPSLATVPDTDGYTLTINGLDYAILPSQTLDLFALGLTDVTSFTLSGIDPTLMLDPDNASAFPLGVSLASLTGSEVSFTMTPVTVDYNLSAVPLPASLPLLLCGLAGLQLIRRRKHS
ncbi:choice-of-anchor L domain-containing protein [Thioclava kandeliae]|uniref:Choice-of-anchor L domain-containing protein n=1 Tax=Thioclava kandeliae TaxID=3070818 RepID=A0ABV1SN41_9RHOB